MLSLDHRQTNKCNDSRIEQCSEKCKTSAVFRLLQQRPSSKMQQNLDSVANNNMCKISTMIIQFTCIRNVAHSIRVEKLFL
jgi:hypothetical protein